MKDSHIDWIGAIPEDWSTIPFMRVFEITKRLAGRTGLDVLSVTQQGIKIKDLSSNEGQMAQDYSNYQLVFPTDFVMNHMDLLTGYVDISSYTGVTSPDYRVFRARKPQEISLEYFLHIFQLCYKCKIFYHLGQGVSGLGRWRLPAKQMLLFELPLPPLNEQQAIAGFLNKKCGEIDEMVSLQEKIVEELKAYKQSVITEAVCKGLNPDVPMKDSGIEWIGMTPVGWATPKIKYYIRISSGEAVVNEALEDNGDYEVWGGGESVMGYHSVYNIDGERLIVGRVGACGYVKRSKGKKFITDNALILNITSPILSFDYLYFVLVAANLKRLNTSTAQPLITGTKVYNVHIPIPPIREQIAIADYLDTKCAEIDTLISLKQSKIDSLKEYKKSIIYEYITGKKDLNG